MGGKVTTTLAPGPPTPIFSGLPPATGVTSASIGPNGQFIIPSDWNSHCHRDPNWCRHFIEDAIINLQLPSLFPGATLAPVDKVKYFVMQTTYVCVIIIINSILCRFQPQFYGTSRITASQMTPAMRMQSRKSSTN